MERLFNIYLIQSYPRQEERKILRFLGHLPQKSENFESLSKFWPRNQGNSHVVKKRSVIVNSQSFPGLQKRTFPTGTQNLPLRTIPKYIAGFTRGMGEHVSLIIQPCLQDPAMWNIVVSHDKTWPTSMLYQIMNHEKNWSEEIYLLPKPIICLRRQLCYKFWWNVSNILMFDTFAKTIPCCA